MGENIKMNNYSTDIIKSVLKNYNFSTVKTSLSYINRLFPHLGTNAEILLLCHIQPVNILNENETRYEEQSSGLDVTGSPLLHSFGNDSFNVTISSPKKNWLKREEKYRPVSKQTAITILNLFNEEIAFNENWTLPLFALCDVKNEKIQDVLLGVHHDSSWFMTYKVTSLPMKSFMSIQNGCNELLVQHLKECSESKDNTDITITSTYELCGISSEMYDCQEESKLHFEGHLKIEVIWNDLCFTPSPRALSNYLVAEIVSGSPSSPLFFLWRQILLLNKYLSILEEYRKKDLSSRYSIMPLNFPSDFSTPYSEDDSVITSKLNCLLNGDDSVEVDEENNENPAGDMNIYEIKLIDFIKELPKRENLDFTDRCWRIIRGVGNYNKMTDCIYTVFESLTENNYKPQLNDMDGTRFGRMISELENESGKVSSLAGSSSLELTIDMGLENITRDYMYLLSNMNVMEAYGLRKIFNHVLTGEFNINEYRNKLLNLTRIHISLELLQLIQTHFDCRCDITYSIFECALKKYFDSPFKYDELEENKIYTLNMPAPREFITEVIKTAPSSWMCTLSTEQSIQKLTTVNHYSRFPIFPPNITEPDTCNKNHEKDEMYHVTKALITYFKRN